MERRKFLKFCAHAAGISFLGISSSGDSFSTNPITASQDLSQDMPLILLAQWDMQWC